MSKCLLELGVVESIYCHYSMASQSAFIWSKLTIEALEQCVKYGQIYSKDSRTTTMASFWCLYS